MFAVGETFTLAKTLLNVILPRRRTTLEMLPLTDFTLAEYHVSGRVGFLSDDLPLRRLPDSYYEPWEAIGQNLPELIKTIRIREEIDKLPILSTARLRSEIEWRRAYVLLSFMTQGYIWAGEKPAEV